MSGTSTPLATYSDAAGTILNANPIVLNAGGFPVNGSGAPTAIFLKAQAYKLTLKDSLGVQLWSIDNLTTLAPLGDPFLSDTLANRPTSCKAAITFFVQTDSPYTLFQCNAAGNGWNPIVPSWLPAAIGAVGTVPYSDGTTLQWLAGAAGQQIVNNPAATAPLYQTKPIYDARDIPNFKMDGKYTSGCTSANLSTTITCSSAAFTAADSGKKFIFYPADATVAFSGTINAINTGTAFLALAGAPTSNTGGTLFYASDDTIPAQALINKCGSNVAGNPLQPCRVFFPGPVLLTSTLNVWNKSIDFGGNGWGNFSAGSGLGMGSVFVWAGAANTPIIFVSGNQGSHFHDFHIIGNSGAPAYGIQFQQNGGDAHNNQHNQVSRVLVGPWFIGDPELANYSFTKFNLTSGIQFIAPTANDDQMAFENVLIAFAEYGIDQRNQQSTEHRYDGLWVLYAKQGFTCNANAAGQGWFFANNQTDIYVGNDNNGGGLTSCKLSVTGFGSETNGKFITQGVAGGGSLAFHDSAFNGFTPTAWIDGSGSTGPLDILLDNFAGSATATGTIEMRSATPGILERKTLTLTNAALGQMPFVNIHDSWKVADTRDQNHVRVDFSPTGTPTQFYSTDQLVVGGGDQLELNHTDRLGKFRTWGNIYADSTTPTAAVLCDSIGTGGATSYAYKVTTIVSGRESAVSGVGTCAAGNAVLSGTNYNRIWFMPVPGAQQYCLYLNSGGYKKLLCDAADTHRAGELGNTNGEFAFKDDGSYTPGAAAPTADGTGWLFAASGISTPQLNTTNLVISATAPTISSGFGSSPSIASNNGTAAFTVNVGTGGTASAGVIGLPTATTGWNCFVTNITGTAANRADQHTVQTASSTTTATVQNQTISTGAALVWTASDILRVSCFAY